MLWTIWICIRYDISYSKKRRTIYLFNKLLENWHGWNYRVRVCSQQNSLLLKTNGLTLSVYKLGRSNMRREIMSKNPEEHYWLIDLPMPIVRGISYWVLSELPNKTFVVKTLRFWFKLVKTLFHVWTIQSSVNLTSKLYKKAF